MVRDFIKDYETVDLKKIIYILTPSILTSMSYITYILKHYKLDVQLCDKITLCNTTSVVILQMHYWNYKE